MKIKTIFLSAAMLWPTAQAAYTYVDATTSNTTLNGVALVAPTNFLDGTSSSTDNLWSRRTGGSFDAFEGGDVWESDAGSSTGDRESTDPLITIIALPTAGTYDIVVLFNRGSNRDVAARIGSAPTVSNIFTTGNAFNADQSADPLAIEFDGSYANGRGSNMGAGYLGQVTTTSDNETIQVYINGLIATAATDDERTQYDGVGFQQVPEPGSALLGLLGAGLLLRRRR